MNEPKNDNINNKIKKKKSFAQNVIILIIAQILVKVFGFIYRLVIVNIEGFGDVGSRIFFSRLSSIYPYAGYIFDRTAICCC